MHESAAAAPPRALLHLPAALSALAAIWLLGAAGTVAETGPVGWATPWVPALGFDVAFRLDGLSLTFGLLVTGIGALVLVYAAEYFRRHRRRGQMILLLFLFELSMLGLVLADDAMTLFLFWEATTVASFLLIGFDHERAESRAKAIQALIVTGLGGLALLAALLLLGAEAGTFRLSQMQARAPAIRESASYLPIFLLVVLGCFTKSAQLPFQFWLPNAMVAPTPVSAYLHSATMVKAGVYLLARLAPTLGDTVLWDLTLTLVGGATMLLASAWSLRQEDLKLALAHTTVMGLGALTMLIGAGGAGAAVAFATFLVVHALYKAGLFLVIGVLDKKAGSRMAALLSGLGRSMPLTFAIAAVAGASMAGLPPLFGFLGKEAIYEGALGARVAPGLVALMALAANAMMIAIAGAVALAPFVGPERSPKADPEDGPWAMLLGPAVLAALGLALGLAPALVDGLLIGPTASAVLGAPVEVHLKLWHGLTAALVLSLVTVAAGLALYLRRDDLRDALIRVEASGRLPRAEAGYDRAMAWLDVGAARLAATVQPGRLTAYVRVSVAAMAGLLALALVAGGEVRLPAAATPPAMFLVAAALVAASTAVLPFASSRLLMITALGVCGLGVALMFAIFGAIDVAVTQLMVETLVVVIIAIALLKLPRVRFAATAAARRTNRVNAGVAAALGAGVAVTLLAVTGRPLDLAVTRYYEAASASVAYGRNIVNVILVDFRALDTLGEISVIATAGLAALALIAARSRALQDRDE